MNTILTDDERRRLIGEWEVDTDIIDELLQRTEAAVLAKLREQEPVAISAERSAAYDNIDRFLRNNLDDTDYAAFSRDLETVLAAAPLPAVVQVPQGFAERIAEAHDASLDDDHTECRGILKECLRLLAAAPEAPAQANEWLPLTPEEQNRLDELLKHTRWLMQSMPVMDGLQHSWSLNARDAMQRMHDWLKVYLPPAMLAATPEAQAIPAPWREAMKVAREALKNVEENCAAGDEYPESFMKPGFDPDKLNAALAQLDALEGGE